MGQSLLVTNSMKKTFSYSALLAGFFAWTPPWGLQNMDISGYINIHPTDAFLDVKVFCQSDTSLRQGDVIDFEEASQLVFKRSLEKLDMFDEEKTVAGEHTSMTESPNIMEKLEEQLNRKYLQQLLDPEHLVTKTQGQKQLTPKYLQQLLNLQQLLVKFQMASVQSNSIDNESEQIFQTFQMKELENQGMQTKGLDGNFIYGSQRIGPYVQQYQARPKGEEKETKGPRRYCPNIQQFQDGAQKNQLEIGESKSVFSQDFEQICVHDGNQIENKGLNDGRTYKTEEEVDSDMPYSHEKIKEEKIKKQNRK